ncbi:MAG: hypothetical protein U0P81_01595 [Holophagaceae bacterium]
MSLDVKPRQNPGRLLLAGLGLLALLGGGAFLATRTAAPPRILLLDPPADAADGLEAEQRRALQELVGKELESTCGATVVEVARPLDPAVLRDLPGRDRFVELRARREGDRLALGVRLAEAGALRRQGEAAWREVAGLAQDPAEALRGALAVIEPAARAHADHHLPRQPAHFWSLLKAWQWHRINDRLPEALQLVEGVCRAEPDCLMAWTTRGDLLYRRLLIDPLGHPLAQNEAEACFQKALGECPAHPQAVFLLAELKIDAGDQRAALDLLREGLASRPGVVPLHTALVYAARTAGLLELARQALEARDRRVPAGLQASSAENTWLYLGDLPRFEASLFERPGNPRNTVVKFYRGYLALMKGDRSQALDHFRETSRSPYGYGQFIELAEVYARMVEGRREEALAGLRRLDQERVGLRVPDGEFTFKLAEAYALLGERGEALTMATRAYHQGFSCLRWYRQDPFLRSLEGLPRWQALLGHLQERQAALEARYPAGGFRRALRR